MWKLIYTASGEDVKNKYDEILIFATEEEVKKAAIEESIAIYEKRPYEFSEGGFIYGTSTPIVSPEKIYKY